MVILAHRIAPASLLALVFGNLPDAWAGAGASIIISSGLHTAFRERICSPVARAKVAAEVAKPLAVV
jgi:hypothetical protein